MTTKQIEDTLDAGVFGSIGAPMARRELERRRAAETKLAAALDSVRTGSAQSQSDREAHEKWEAEQALTERSVRAAEAQATYAKRAYHRSNIALWLSGIAVGVTAFFALLDFLKP
ncbi:MAG: hypothetical protein JWR84_3270 [Caulobacter sp.]|nr:hypothetical protein [Caulobacter sp.]